MKIGVVGAGHMGFGLGSVWAEKGHQVCFSYSRSLARLQAAIDASGMKATVSTPVEAAGFGDVVLLAIHWPQVAPVVCDIRPRLAGKALLTCVVPWNRAHTGLAVGTIDSAAEEIARLAPTARVVEALPILADTLHRQPSRLGAESPTLFYCGDDPAAKALVEVLLDELDVCAIDLGDLTNARFLEPCTALLWQLATAKGAGTDIGLKLVHR